MVIPKAVLFLIIIALPALDEVGSGIVNAPAVEPL